MRCRVPILLCVLLLCSVLLGAVPAAGQQPTDGTHLEAQLQADGDAEWTVSVRLPIETDDEREEFEAFASRFEAGESDLELGEDAFERAVDEASTASGREMAIESVRRDSEVVTAAENGDETEQYGELRLEFTWESFARLGENDTLYVDDAFNTTDGTWLPGLGADQTLTIRAPPGYGAPTTSPIGADDGDLYWEGPATFEPGYFTIVYQPATTAPIDTEGISTTLVVGALLLSATALLLGVYLLLARRWGDSDDSDGGGLLPNRGEEPSTMAGTEPVPSEDDTQAASDSDLSDDDVDFDLLSDEERVEYLLEQNGGRMKQATIVKETGWSNAKVSQLLSSMDDDDRVDKLRIGRENLISLPGEGIGELDEGDTTD